MPEWSARFGLGNYFIGLESGCARTVHFTLLKSSTYIDSRKEIDNNDTKFKIGDIVRISKYTNIFAKDYSPNWFEKVFVINKYSAVDICY